MRYINILCIGSALAVAVSLIYAMDQELKYRQTVIDTQESTLQYQREVLSEISVHLYDEDAHVIRMERIMGVDSPDGFLTIAEKRMIAPYIKTLNKADLR